MLEAPIPADEESRLALLKACRIMHTPSEEAFDDIVRLAAELCGTEIALITLVDADRQWFKARVGVEQTETARDLSFCGHCINDRQPMVIEDTLGDPRFADNPLVTRRAAHSLLRGRPLVGRRGLFGRSAIRGRSSAAQHYATPSGVAATPGRPSCARAPAASRFGSSHGLDSPAEYDAAYGQRRRRTLDARTRARARRGRSRVRGARRGRAARRDQGATAGVARPGGRARTLCARGARAHEFADAPRGEVTRRRQPRPRSWAICRIWCSNIWRAWISTTCS